MSSPRDSLLNLSADELYKKLAPSAAAVAEKAASEEGDGLIERERQQLEIEQLRTKNRAATDANTRERHLHCTRIVTLIALFALVVVWLSFVIKAIWLCAHYGNEPYVSTHPGNTFQISDQVLIAFITSTTVSVIGIFLIAAKWLFPQNGGTSSAE